MPVPTAITDLSTVAASNYPQGSDSPSTLDDVQRAHGSFIAKLRDLVGLVTGTYVPATAIANMALTPANLGAAPIANPTFTTAASAPHFFALDTGGGQFGGSAPVGVYLDANNIALRSPSNTGIVYFQNNGGGSNYGNASPSGITCSVGAFIGPGTSLTGTANSLSAGLGVNQAYSAPARSFGSPYTNSTGKTITVTATAAGPLSGAVRLDGFVGGTQIKASYTTPPAGQGSAVCLDLIVPNGATYQINQTGNNGGNTPVYWYELS